MEYGSAARQKRLTANGWSDLVARRTPLKSPDLLAGVAVAAVEIPTALAYAELAGFPPVVGLYASILPLIPYAHRRLVATAHCRSLTRRPALWLPRRSNPWPMEIRFTI